MAYESWVPMLFIGIVLIIVGSKMPLSFPIANLVRLALIVIGVGVFIGGILGGADQFASSSSILFSSVPS